MTKQSKAPEPTGCPVEPYARRVAQMLRTWWQSDKETFKQVTNLSEAYGRKLVFEQISAMETLAVCEAATSEIGRIFQLMATHYQCLTHFDILGLRSEQTEKEQTEKEQKINDLFDQVQMGLEAVIWSAMQACDDPDIAALQAYYGPSTDQPEEYQNGPSHLLVMDYVNGNLANKVKPAA